MVKPGLLEEATHLTPTDRLELIGALWDSLSPDDLPHHRRRTSDDQ